MVVTRGRGATGSRGSIDPHFSGAGSTYGAWPLTFCPFFPSADLSTLSTTHALVGSDAVLQWLREQILTESINLSTMELWNSLPDNLRHLDLSVVQFCRALKTHLFWRSLRRLVIFILVRCLWIYLLTYLTKEATQIIHHFVQKL